MAMGIIGEYQERITGVGIADVPYGRPLWNPLTDNDDCAEMCAQLMIDTSWDENNKCVDAMHPTKSIVRYEHFKNHNNDRLAAWRHAACLVAAMMGEKV